MFTIEVLRIGAANRRANARARLDAPGIARAQGGAALVCRVADFARDGAQLLTCEPLDRDSDLTLYFPYLRPIRGTVRWADDLIAGVQFDTPMSDAEYAFVIDRYGVPPEGPPPLSATA